MSENNKERPDDATLIRSGGILEGVLVDRNMRVCAETVGDITARLSSLVQENTELKDAMEKIRLQTLWYAAIGLGIWPRGVRVYYLDDHDFQLQVVEDDRSRERVEVAMLNGNKWSDVPRVELSLVPLEELGVTE